MKMARKDMWFESKRNLLYKGFFIYFQYLPTKFVLIFSISLIKKIREKLAAESFCSDWKSTRVFNSLKNVMN